MTVSAYLLDVEGTLYTENGPVPGAPEAVQRLRAARVPVRYVSNTTRRPRAALVDRLRSYGFPAEAGHVLTAVLAGADLLRHAGIRAVAPFVHPDALTDLGEFDLVGGTSGRPLPAGRPDAVVVGDLGDGWTYDLLNQAFRLVADGAVLVALSRDRWWERGDGPALDAGPFVAALENAAGVEATLAGKPMETFWTAALASLGLAPDADRRAVAMVGDDLWTDVRGAQLAGLEGWLVKTGKFRAEAFRQSRVEPDRLLGSAAELAP
ncbi:MAG TPA: TIGR01458 family HAD-type hydrolase [Gemmatimonadales bacterium]|nr:TIGR01458 family HAD-type hydrolase [Gemmatimonadales bacterium]